MHYILYAIPFFFLLIALELVLEKVRKTDFYRVNDAINSLSAGVLSRMTDIVKKLLPFTIYAFVYEHFALFQLPDSYLVLIIAFVFYDFCYYWNHRLGHEMNLLWAAHVVHHSSEEYNLTTALRQTGGSLFSWIFYLPMAILGFDPILVVSVGALNLIYQFWVHTRHLPKLGWFEWVFVSPSNHRVHHAQNPVYLDRNYGGVLIIWDRLFASFQAELEQEKPVFGVRKPLASWNPVWANLQVYSWLARDAWYTRRWQDKIKIWFKRTGWRPDDVAQRFPMELTDLSQFRKFDIALSPWRKTYALLQHAVITFVGVMFMLHIANLAVIDQAWLVAYVVCASVSVGAVMEHKRWAVWLEWIRNLGLLVACFVIALPDWMSVSLIVAASASLLLWLKVSREQRQVCTQAWVLN